MNDIHNIYKKANLLMTNALEKYRKGDMEGGDKDRQLANQLFDQAEMMVNSETFKRGSLYGESRNFGIIYNTFEHNTKALFESKDKRRLIGKFIKLLKENKTLKAQFELYNSLKNAEDVRDPERYVVEALSLMPSFNKKEIKEANDKLVDFIRKNELDEAFEIADEDMNLYEAIEYVMFNGKSYHNLNEYILHEGIIREYVKKHNTPKKEVKDIDEMFNEHIERYNGLSDDEVEYMDKLVSDESENRKMFEEKKGELLSLISENFSEVDDENTDRWQKIYEHVENKKFDNETCSEDIRKFDEIKKEINS